MKGLLHRLSVKKFRLPLLRVGAQHTGTDATLVEDGHTDRGANRPRAAETADQIMQGGTFKPRRRCQRDRGEERRLGHGYEGVTGDELLLCLADVRPAVEQSRWQARRERRSLLLLQLHSTANDGAGVSTEQDIKLVLGLLDLHFQTGERRAGSFHKHLGLARIQFGGVAVVYAKLNQRERVVADLKSLPSDFKFLIEVLQQKVVTRYISHERLQNHAAGLLAGKDSSARSRGLIADLSPEIELPASVHRQAGIARIDC